MLTRIVFQLGKPTTNFIYCFFSFFLFCFEQNDINAHHFITTVLVIVVYSTICGIQYYRRYSQNLPIISHSNKESNFDTTLRGTFTKKS